MRFYFLIILFIFLPFLAKSQIFPQAPSLSPSNFNQFLMMNNYTNYQRSGEVLLKIVEKRVIKLQNKIEKKIKELDSLKIKKAEFTHNTFIANDKEINKNNRKTENFQENIEDLNVKLDK